ncbi:GNAT family N-acetyltransferase [Streptomyces sp. S.PB5]|uniref:GNAT family N-acetyltransferase n=1 Tax=Streptomyces sp. S.PB5 TaxID=3020844 RepID=UPI0025AFCE7E|nr:GNAT family N-acetyltransferase [Streptomyces sp. S.PB5]MDN3028548.1 GNAT family N-acetyltransferase [Streptomyces sp. S.PB5]
MTDTDADLSAVDTAARAWMKAVGLFALTQPGGHCRTGPHGTSALVTGAPTPLLNGVISTVRLADPEEIAALAAAERPASVPWSLQLRGTQVDDRIAATAAGHGLTERSHLPFMLKELDERELTEPGAGQVKVRRITGAEGNVYRAALAAGYEGPEEAFAVFAAPAVMDHPTMRAYVAEEDGVVVATSFGVFVDSHVGVFNIAVPPQHRRHGYGTAATAAVLRDGYEVGKRTAFLHASVLGVPLYRTMGFHVAEEWTLFTP